MASIESKYEETTWRWHRLCLAQFAALELWRSQQWTKKSDQTATECLRTAEAKFPCKPAEVPFASSEERACASLRSSVHAYSELRSLAGGAKVNGSTFACHAVRTASRLLRDLIVWRSFSLGGMTSIPKFLDVLERVFELSLGDNENLKSQMVQAWRKELINLGLEQARAVPRRKGKKQWGASSSTDDFEAIPDASNFWPMAQNLLWPFPFMVPCPLMPLGTWPVFNQNSWYNHQDVGHTPEPAEANATMAADGQLSILETDRPLPHRMSPELTESEQQRQECVECKSVDPNGWPWKGQHWCGACWKKWSKAATNSVSTKQNANDHNDSNDANDADDCGVDDGKKLMLVRMPARAAIRHHVFKTDVEVVNVCCLTAACFGSSPACIVALHPTGVFIDSQQCRAKWPVKALCERTSFGNEIQLYEDEVVPRESGFYWPGVRVDKDEFGDDIDPDRVRSVPVVFGCPPWAPNGKDGSQVEFREEMRTKISNILRICQIHGHQDLIISARFKRFPVRQVAGLFREVLLESGDAVGAFRRVVFALPREEVPATTILAFQEEFRYAKNTHCPHETWKDGKRLVPMSQSDLRQKNQAVLCLDVVLRDAMWNEVNGSPLIMFESLDSSSRNAEYQRWTQLPCGRIVLAAFPQLCLSVKPPLQSHGGAQVHIWHRVEKNHEYQIWETLEDGGVALAKDRSLRLSISENDDVLLCAKGQAHTLIFWQVPQENGSRSCDQCGQDSSFPTASSELHESRAVEEVHIAMEIGVAESTQESEDANWKKLHAGAGDL